MIRIILNSNSHIQMFKRKKGKKKYFLEVQNNQLIQKRVGLGIQSFLFDLKEDKQVLKLIRMKILKLIRVTIHPNQISCSLKQKQNLILISFITWKICFKNL